MHSQEKHPRRDMWLALALTTLLFAIAHGHGLADPWVVNDDARQQLFWMQQWQDPELYHPHGGQDMLADYARRYVTWGVRAVYQAGSLLAEPLQFSKLLAGVEFIALGGLLFALGRGLGGRAAGWCVLCLFWLSPFFLHTISGGLARSFGAPLLALFWLSWQQGQGVQGPRRHLARLGVLTSLLLLGLFLPYIWALCALALGLGWLWGLAKPGIRPPAPCRWFDFAALAVSALPVLLFNQELAGSGYGPMASAAAMEGDPVFGPLGRFPILPVPSLFFELVARPWERLLPFRELGPVAGTLVGVVFFILLWQGARRLSRSDWKTLGARLLPLGFLALASLGLYAAARLLLLLLFIPSRYLEYTTNLAYVVIPGLLLAVYWEKGFPRSLRRPATAAALVLLCLPLAGARLYGDALYDYGKNAPLYEAVRQTPKGALFAGHPYTMDNVLTFGRRSVLASYELAHPWSEGLWRRLRPRLEDMLGAYYARDPERVRIFCQTWNVDYIVVNEEHFSRAFLMPGRQLVPVCQAPMPDLAHSVCRALGLRFPVTVWLGSRQGYPGDHPLFAPYGGQLASLARLPEEARHFVLLDSKTFPGREVQPGVRLVDVRSLRQEPPPPAESKE